MDDAGGPTVNGSCGILFTLIIPVFHGGRFLRSALDSICNLDFPSAGFEVLIAGHKEDQDSPRIVSSRSTRTDSHLGYICRPGSCKAALLNAACLESRGKYLLFADDDCIMPPDWLSQFQEVLESRSDIGMVGGADELEQGGSAFDVALDCVLHSVFVRGRRPGRNGPGFVKYYPKLFNMAIPRSTAFDVALRGPNGSLRVFDESLIVHEEVELAQRIERSGRRLLFAPEIRVRHFRDTSFLSFIRRNLDLGRACRRLGIHRWPQRMLSAFVLMCAFLLVVSVFFHPWRWILLGCIVVYLFAGSVTGITAWRRSGRFSTFPLAVLLLLSLHLSRGAGYLLPPMHPPEADRGD